MTFLTAAALAIVMVTAPLPRTLQVSRLPRLPDVADLSIWRAINPDRLVYGAAPKPVFVRAKNARAQRLLRRLGAQVTEDQWSLVHMDASALLAAVASGEALQLRTPPSHHPLTERSIPETGVDRVVAGWDLPQSRRGRGVLVGVVDTGIDLNHPAFQTPDGRSRVIAVWDQDAIGRAPWGFGYGDECTTSIINAGDCRIVDPSGHGTHVAGIAAGDASLPGVAREADIAVVQSRDFTRLADAVSYLVDLAERRGQPVVINISVGGHYGAHDGRTPLESYLGRMVGPGRLLVAAAGNDGGANVHVGLDLEDRAQRVELANLPVGIESVVELWNPPTESVQVAVELWVNNEVQLRMPLVGTDTDYIDRTEPVAFRGTRVLSGLGFALEYVHEHQRVRRTIVLDRTDAQSLPTGWSLALSLAGTGRIEGWLSQSSYADSARTQAAFGTSSRAPGWAGGDAMSSITVPATAPSVIAVGCFAVRDAWMSQSAGWQLKQGLSIGDLAAYSSRGPTALPSFTGLKPEIVAPGAWIASARVLRQPYAPSYVIDNYRVVMQGTSMAAPFVAGVIALMLEADPTLGPQKVRHVLASTARVDNFTGAVPNDAWGNGKVNAYAAVLQVEEMTSGCAAARSPGTQTQMPWLLTVLAAAARWRRRRHGSPRCPRGLRYNLSETATDRHCRLHRVGRCPRSCPLQFGTLDR